VYLRCKLLFESPWSRAAREPQKQARLGDSLSRESQPRKEEVFATSRKKQFSNKKLTAKLKQPSSSSYLGSIYHCRIACCFDGKKMLANLLSSFFAPSLPLPLRLPCQNERGLCVCVSAPPAPSLATCPLYLFFAAPHSTLSNEKQTSRPSLSPLSLPPSLPPTHTNTHTHN